jgi:hypothetical protein
MVKTCCSENVPTDVSTAMFMHDSFFYFCFGVPLDANLLFLGEEENVML